MNVGWRERNQQAATNLMLIIIHLSQHVLGIIMPIIRRTRLCTTAYGVLIWLCWPWLCGAGCRWHSAHSLQSSSTQPQPAQPVQNTICGSAQSCSPSSSSSMALQPGVGLGLLYNMPPSLRSLALSLHSLAAAWSEHSMCQMSNPWSFVFIGYSLRSEAYCKVS